MRSLYYDFQIDGQPVPVPDADLSVEVVDLEAEDSGYDESGVLHRFLVRKQVHCITLLYDVLSREEYHYLRALVGGKDTFSVQYRGVDGQPSELIGYCTGLQAALHNAKQGIYKGLKLVIREC